MWKSQGRPRQETRLLVAKYAEKRATLRKASKDITLSLEERMEARAELTALPRNSSDTRVRSRCKISGRPRGYVRRLGISRNCSRSRTPGVLPGLRKASY